MKNDKNKHEAILITIRMLLKPSKLHNDNTKTILTIFQKILCQIQCLVEVSELKVLENITDFKLMAYYYYYFVIIALYYPNKWEILNIRQFLFSDWFKITSKREINAGIYRHQ